MNQDEILQALRAVAMGRFNTEQVQKLAEELAGVLPKELPAPGNDPAPEAKPTKRKG